MKNLIISLSLIITLSSCKKEINLFSISKQDVGLLNDSTKVKDLDVIYANDSIVKSIAGDEFTGRINDIEIFEKGGKHLLSITPSEALDSTATIRTIKVIDSRYTTTEGINISSTFGDIKSKYTISSIQNTLNNAVVFTKDSPYFFTISKDDLAPEFRFDMSKKIDAVQIPDNAKIKYFMIGW